MYCSHTIASDIFSARDHRRGEAAVAALQQEGLHPKFHQLDITDTDSIRKLADYLKDNYGGLDVLVNNAAIAYKVPGPVSERILSQEMDLRSLITLNWQPFISMLMISSVLESF